jgi:uncharacterized membrane protein YdbT with pleckstrin-like domain
VFWLFGYMQRGCGSVCLGIVTDGPSFAFYGWVVHAILILHIPFDYIVHYVDVSYAINNERNIIHHFLFVARTTMS